MIHRNILLSLIIFLILLIITLTVAVFIIRLPNLNKKDSNNNLFGEQPLTISDNRSTAMYVVRLKEVTRDNKGRVYAFVESNNAKKQQINTVFLTYDKTKYNKFYIHKVIFKNPKKIYDNLTTYNSSKEVYDGLNNYKNKIIKLSIVLQTPEEKIDLSSLSENIECNNRYYEVISGFSNKKLGCQPFFAEIEVYEK